MIRMAFQHRPEHPFDFRAILKPVDHQLGVFKRCFNARLHRMQSAVGYIHIVGRCGLPHRRHGIKHLGPSLLVAAHHAHQDVGMACDVFGGGMHDNIDANSQRLEVKRRCPCVVDHAPDAMLLAFGGDCRHVRQFKAVRTRRFHHQQGRVGFEFLLDGRTDIRVEKFHFHAHLRENLFGKVTRGAVNGVHEKRMATRMHKRKKRRGRARQPRCERPDACRALERFHRIVKSLMRFRAPDAVRRHILDQLITVLFTLDHVLDRFMQHGRAFHNRRIDEAVFLIAMPPGMHQNRCRPGLLVIDRVAHKFSLYSIRRLCYRNKRLRALSGCNIFANDLKHFAAVTRELHFPHARSLRELPAVDRTQTNDVFERRIVENLIRQFAGFVGFFPSPLL